MKRIIDYEIENIDFKDYPDFVDCYISYAELEDGTMLTDDDLDVLNDDRDLVYNLLLKKLGVN